MAKVVITFEQLSAMGPCAPHEMAFNEKRQATVRSALKAGVSVSDILWVAGRLDFRAEVVEFASQCASRARNYADAAAARYAADAAAAAAAAAAIEFKLQKAHLIKLFGSE